MKINFITNYKNDSIFSSDQYGHYSAPFSLAREILEQKGYGIFENHDPNECHINIYRDLPINHGPNDLNINSINILHIWESPVDRPYLFNNENWLHFDLLASAYLYKNHHKINYFSDITLDEKIFIEFSKRKLACALCSNRYDGILAPRRSGQGIFGLPILQRFNLHWHNNLFDILNDRSNSLYSTRRKYLKDRSTIFDLYGKFWEKNDRQTWLPLLSYLPRESFNSLGREIPDKQKLVSQYRFCFAFENASPGNGYHSEKIHDAFHCLSVPIYYGDDSIFNLVPDNTIIYIDRKYTPLKLKEIVNSYTEESWMDMIMNIKNFISSAEYKNEYSKKAICNQIIALVDKAHKMYKEKNINIVI